jgi:hypothetical protein
VKGIEGVNVIEFPYNVKCYNAGLMSIDEEYKNKEI